MPTEQQKKKTAQTLLQTAQDPSNPSNMAKILGVAGEGLWDFLSKAQEYVVPQSVEELALEGAPIGKAIGAAAGMLPPVAKYARKLYAGAPRNIEALTPTVDELLKVYDNLETSRITHTLSPGPEKELSNQLLGAVTNFNTYRAGASGDPQEYLEGAYSTLDKLKSSGFKGWHPDRLKQYDAVVDAMEQFTQSPRAQSYRRLPDIVLNK